MGSYGSSDQWLVVVIQSRGATTAETDLPAISAYVWHTDPSRLRPLIVPGKEEH